MRRRRWAALGGGLALLVLALALISSRSTKGALADSAAVRSVVRIVGHRAFVTRGVDCRSCHGGSTSPLALATTFARGGPPAP